jgi:hypothetical protein
MPPYGSQIDMIALKRHDPRSVSKANAESGIPKSAIDGFDAHLTKASKEHPDKTDEHISLVQKAADALSARLTGGVSFVHTPSDPFAIAGVAIADYFEHRGGGTYVFRIDDLFRDIEAYRGPGQISANTPRV